MSTTHPNPKRASDRNAHANNSTPRTPRTTSEPAPARSNSPFLRRGTTCRALRHPGLTQCTAFSSASIPLAIIHGPVCALRSTHSTATTPPLSLTESTLPQNTPRNPSKMNISTKTGAGCKAKGARLRRRPPQRSGNRRSRRGGATCSRVKRRQRVYFKASWGAACCAPTKNQTSRQITWTFAWAFPFPRWRLGRRPGALPGRGRDCS